MKPSYKYYTIASGGLLREGVREVSYDLKDFYEQNVDELTFLRSKIECLFADLDAIYTVKGRVKKYKSLCAKIKRKRLKLRTEDDIKAHITDLVGVRLLYLIGENFGVIHKYIMSLIEQGIFELCETPQAYTYDSDFEDTYAELGISVKTKESRYTSVHYTVKLAGVSDFCCEIQVRSLFEEAWSEVEHLVNYPEKSSNPVCRRKLKALAKLVQKSNKLVNSIIAQSKI